MVTPVGHGIGDRTMVLFAKCLLLCRIVFLVVAPGYSCCIGLVHDCYTMVVFVTPIGVGGGGVGEC